MNNGIAVEFRHVSKSFPGSVRAVDDLSLQVHTGKVLALLGPSGCGKTTSLRLVNRLEEPTTGTVLVRGADVRSQRPELLRRTIGYVIQEGGLFPHQNVAANVATVPRLLGWPRPSIRRRVGEVLDMVGLPESDFGPRMPQALSGGQRQRVGVARALAADPDLLLMDEPFGALDPGTRQSIQDEFQRLQAQLKKTVVLVTHDVTEAGRLADEIVVLDHGRMVQRGSLRDLLLRPADARIRAFLGARAEEIALTVLTLQDFLSDLPQDPPGSDVVTLSPRLPLARVLAALAQAPENPTVVVEAQPPLSYSAKRLRERILSDLKTIGNAAPSEENEFRAPSPL